MKPKGVKYDDNKLRYDLVSVQAQRALVAGLTYGAIKYAPGNWRNVEPERYYAALMRHLEAARSGEFFDEESGLPHLALASCCMHFLAALELENRYELNYEAVLKKARIRLKKK